MAVELSVSQRALLDAVSRAKEAKAGIRAKVEKEHRERLELALREVDETLNRRVREAFEAGISKRQIGKQGLGTSDPTIVNRLLEKTAAQTQIEQQLAALAAPAPIRSLSPAEVEARGLPVDEHAEVYVELHYPDFPTQWKGPAEDMPNPLCGVLVRVFGLWSIVEADEDNRAQLEWELPEWENNGGVLVKLLDGFAAQVVAA
jgi:hypothetical protein